MDRNARCRCWVLSDDEVALRKESVDRNKKSTLILRGPESSLSARRAWIEIRYFFKAQPAQSVALRKESVDRNKAIILAARLRCGRSPQGERG